MKALAALLLVVAAGAAAAQPVSLVADRVRIEGDRTLIAEGDVEVFYEDTRLTASRVVYDGETEGLTVEGPIRITESEGRIVVLGDSAELEPGLRDGLLTGARLVLDQQMQVAAAELARIDGRYRQLTNAVASSCRVCAGSPTPLWEIRAARVLHDTETRQIYFSRAQLRVAGVPVAYVPRLRLPDPTLRRSRGFLAPQIKGTSDIGQGPRIPYFIPLGRSADVTLAPWITGSARTLELRYRQAFRRGTVEVEAAASRDDLGPDETRSYVHAKGRFQLPRAFSLGIDLRDASDVTYADEYGYTSASRLESRVAVSRFRPREFINVAAFNYDILRPGSLDEGDKTLTNFADATYVRALPSRWGRLTFGLDASAYDRDSDRQVIGRDVQRLGVEAGWAAAAVGPAGLVFEADAALSLDAYAIDRDPNFATSAARAVPAAAVAVRWPLLRTRDGVAHTLEPIAQLAWSDVLGGDVPDEDSRAVDFDEGNLFALDRFPGRDRSETGARLNLGLGYGRLAPAWRFSGYAGRVLRFDDEMQFSDATGLNGTWSDWLVSGQIGVGEALTLTNRAVFDDGFDVARNELRLALEAGSAAFSTSYLWLEAEPEVDRRGDVHEAIFGAGYAFGRHWSGAVESRWDLVDERISSTDLDLSYRNECLQVDFFLSRSFDSGASVEPTYDFGVEVSLRGIGGANASRQARSCPG